MAVGSITLLVLHAKLMRRREAADRALLLVDELSYIAEDDTDDINPHELEDAVFAYNIAVGEYNAYIAQYPGRLMAVLAGIRRLDEI